MPDSDFAKNNLFYLLIRFWRVNAKVLFLLVAVIFVVTLLSASVRMVGIAFSSQPECVEHRKTAHASGSANLAAKSSC